MQLGSIGFEFPPDTGTTMSYRSRQSLFDFDVLFIDWKGIFQEYAQDTRDGFFQGKYLLDRNASHLLLDDIRRRSSELESFLSSGKPVVIFLEEIEKSYYYTGRTSQSGTGRNQKTTQLVDDVLSTTLFGIKLPAAIPATGEQISHNEYQRTAGYWKENKDWHIYRAYLEGAVGEPFLYVKNTDKIVGTIIRKSGGAIVVVPPLKKSRKNFKTKAEQTADRKLVVQSLVDLSMSLTKGDEIEDEPDWSQSILMPGEAEIRKEVAAQEQVIRNAVEEIERLNRKIVEINRSKKIFTAQGTSLEREVGAAFERCGFEVEVGQEGRVDLIIRHNESTFAVEIKGLIKSAGEKNCAQLEKWVSDQYIDLDVQAKGILVVNAFYKTPVEQRTELAFPDQMLKYARDRNHCLMTSLQLLCMSLDVAMGNTSLDEVSQLIIDTKGPLQGYADPFTHLSRYQA